VQLNFFPILGQGNMHTSLDGGARPQRGNGLAWDAHKHLQVIRQGTLLYFRTSADGLQWKDIPGSPLERKDMEGLPLQVGLTTPAMAPRAATSSSSPSGWCNPKAPEVAHLCFSGSLPYLGASLAPFTRGLRPNLLPPTF